MQWQCSSRLEILFKQFALKKKPLVTYLLRMSEKD
jgi:hypothetical protein